MKKKRKISGRKLLSYILTLVMILGLMRSPDLEESSRMAYLRDLYELLARMKWLIETMLSLSRIEADAVRFAKNAVSCRELIRQLSRKCLAIWQAEHLAFLMH